MLQCKKGFLQCEQNRFKISMTRPPSWFLSHVYMYSPHNALFNLTLQSITYVCDIFFLKKKLTFFLSIFFSFFVSIQFNQLQRLHRPQKKRKKITSPFPSPPRNLNDASSQ